MLSNKAIFLFILVVLVVMWFGGAIISMDTANKIDKTGFVKNSSLENNALITKPINKDDKCVPAGCSKQLCIPKSIAKDIMSTCEYKEVYSCYRKALCEKQPSGRCGWIETPELVKCVDRVESRAGKGNNILH